jgi:Xaa-Pro aminopeptidase
MSHVDRRRAMHLMAERGLDGLVLTQPESFAWATGATPGVGAMWRRAGAAIAVVPADPDRPIAAVASDLFAPALRSASPSVVVRTHPLWVDAVDLTGTDRTADTDLRLREAYAAAGHPPGFVRPTTFDLRTALAHLGEILADAGIRRAGLDLDFLPVADHAVFRDGLPAIDWQDGSDAVRRLKMVKAPTEIARLRAACRFADAGWWAMVAAATEGASRADLATAWRAGAEAAARSEPTFVLTSAWEYIAVGSDPWSGQGTVAPGALIKADVGCVVGGYTSDGARTFVRGGPEPIAADVFRALRCGFDAGLPMFRPGVRLADIHATVLAAVRGTGIPGYARGHFGHGLGAGMGSEEWPFVAADADVVLEPGMVMAFETPFYGRGLGALMIEDMIVITTDGAEVLSTLPRDLVILD